MTHNHRNSHFNSAQHGVCLIAAIIIFSLSAFFAGGVRAQSKILVDTGSGVPSGCENAPSIAVQPWDVTGDTLAASWRYTTGYNHSWIYTSRSVNGGASWIDNGRLTLPTGSATECDTVAGDQFWFTADARLAYRGNTSGQRQLVCVFHAYNDWSAGAYARFDGTFVGFSNNNGSTWTAETPVETNAICNNSYHEIQTSRPYVVADNISSGSLRNNTYVCWTHSDEYVGNTSSVKVGTILPGSNTISSVYTVDTGSSLGNDTLQALALAVESNGTVFFLWRHLNAGVTPETFTLYIDSSSNGGVTWSAKHAVETGVEIPTFNFGYQDYPVMTISKSGTTETIFIAYTKGMGSSTTNPSDLFLISSPVASLSWSTPLLINADSLNITPVTSNTNKYTFQYQLAICPDGNGGVNLLYYTQQASGSPKKEVPVLYETPGTCSLGQHRQISIPIPAFTNSQADSGVGISDYCGLAWNPVRGTANPIWTDTGSDGTDDVFTLALSSKPLAGVTNYNNQRKVVGDASQLHWIVEQDTGTTNKITYHHTEATNPDDVLTPDTTFANPLSLFRREPSIATYSMPGTLDPNDKYICAVWEAYPTLDSDQNKVIEYALAKWTATTGTWAWILAGGLPFNYRLTQSVVFGNEIIDSDGRNDTTLAESKAYEITPVVAPVIHTKAFGSTECVGFRIFWANGPNQIRTIAIDTNGAVKFKEFPVSKAISAERPSCVSSFWYNPTDPNYINIWNDNGLGTDNIANTYTPISIGPNLNGNNGTTDYQGSALDEKVHVVWEENDASHAAGIMATEAYSDFSDDSTWLVIGHAWALDYWPLACPPYDVTQEDHTYWDLTGLAQSTGPDGAGFDAGKPANSGCDSGYMLDDSHDPCIALDEYGRQRVTWRINGTCVNTGNQYSGVVTLKGGPVTTQVCEDGGTCSAGSWYIAWCCNIYDSCYGPKSTDGGNDWFYADTTCDSVWYCCTSSDTIYYPVCNPPNWVCFGGVSGIPIYGWRNSYASPVFWSWNTVDGVGSGGANLILASPTITAGTLDPAKTTDNVEVVWLTNEGTLLPNSTRVADDIDDDGNFSYSAGEIPQPPYGMATNFPSQPFWRNGISSPNTALGNSLDRPHGGYAYSMTCSGDGIVGFGSEKFNPDGLYKIAEGGSPDQAAMYSANGKFYCQLSGLTVQGRMESNLLHAISSEREVSNGFHITAGASFTVNLLAKSMGSGSSTKLVLEHSDGSKEVLVPFACKGMCAEVIKYTSPIGDDCRLIIEANTGGSVISSNFSAAPSLALRDTVFLGSMPGSPATEGALAILDNPFNTQLKIQATIPSNFPADLRVINMLGATVATILTNESAPESFQYVLNTQDWPSGAYFVRLEIGNGIITKRIIKIQ